jgi:penicillin-binding protein 2
MSLHPNDIQRRGRAATIFIVVTFVILASAFFRTQVLENERYALQSEENRLREVPLPAPRGIIYDRNGEVIAENLPGYTVSLLAPTADSLRAALRRLGGTITLTNDQIELAVRRYRRAPNRPAVILSDASFDVVSVLEEHRVDFPGLIIQSTPKRYYPDGEAVSAFVGYTGEITESELNPTRLAKGYKAGHQIGKAGLEKQYEEQLRGREGMRFVEVDARGRVVREAGARQDLVPESGPSLETTIDLKLQRFMHSIFGDSLQGGAVALDPKTGGVLAIHSHPGYDPNRFVGGIPVSYWRELNEDERRPLYNKALQGRYPPASTWKLATSIIGLELGIVKLQEHQPVSCTGGFQYGSRYFRCWEKRGHGNLNLLQAIEKSCDVYFYQLGLKIGLSRLLAGGVSLNFRERSGIDLPNEAAPIFPYAADYYNRRYGPRGWTNAVVLNLSIGQGENSQNVLQMARFYTALATDDGQAATPHIAKINDTREKIVNLPPEQMRGLREAMAGVVTARGTAGSAAIQGVILAGKTGTAQHHEAGKKDHAWFVGFAPQNDPKIVVAVMIEYGDHGYLAARIASKIIQQYLGVAPTELLQTEGD